MNPSTGGCTMGKMQECLFTDFLLRIGAHQMLVVSLTYAVTAVHSSGRNGKDCALHLLTFFPFVALFQFKSCESRGHFMLWKDVSHWPLVCTTQDTTPEILPAIYCLHLL